MRYAALAVWVALTAAAPPCAPAAARGGGAVRPGPAAAHATLGRFEAGFRENVGQAHPSVALYGGRPGARVSFTSRGIVFDLGGSARPPAGPRARVALELLGGDPDVRPVGRRPVGAPATVFRGGPREWTTGIVSFAEVVYPALWPGVDLVVRESADGLLEYEFVVAPGADPSRVRLAYRCPRRAELTPAGEVEARTAAGVVRERAPASFQDAGGVRTPVASAFRVLGDSEDLELGFAVGAYDPSKPLVIDPEVVFSGLLGGSRPDTAADVAVDANGDVYVAGAASSAPSDGFPVAGGPRLDYAPNERDLVDAFVAKISGDGTRVIYCGYIGGESWDYATGVAVDRQGSAYVYGTTYSNSTTEHFPVVVGPDLLRNGGTEYRYTDVFVSKVSPDGTSLLYSGYVNGAANEDSGDIAVDAQGSAVIVATFQVGRYFGQNQPAPLFDRCQLFDEHGAASGVVIKIKPDGSGLVMQNWVMGPELDSVLGVAVDATGAVYVTGFTASPSLVCYMKGGPALTPGGGADAFVGKLTADMRSFEYLGFLGGAADDAGTRVAVDAAGNAYVVGFTKSTEATFPVLVGPDLTFNGPAGSLDAFVAKVKPNGTLAYCGYLGGTADETAAGVAVDSRGRAWVTGSTASTDFPVADAVDPTFNGGAGVGDAFVARVAADGKSLDVSTFFGGSGRDTGIAVDLDPQGNAVVVGVTDSADGSFPATAGAFNATARGAYDVFVVKLRGGPAGPPPPSISAATKAGKALVVTGANFAKGAKVLVNGTEYKTKADAASPTTKLTSKKAGKVVKTGDAITVRNPDGGVSNAVTFSG